MVIVTAVLLTYDVTLAALMLLITSFPRSCCCHCGSGRRRCGPTCASANSLAAVIGDILAESLSGVRVIAYFNRQRQNNINRHQTISRRALP